MAIRHPHSKPMLFKLKLWAHLDDADRQALLDLPHRRREGYVGIEAHFAGPQLKRDLKARLNRQLESAAAGG